MGLNIPAVRTGDMRHVLKIEQRTFTKDSDGNDTETWAEHATVRAAMRPTSGREYFSGRQVVAEASTVITTWYQPINGANYRVIYDDPKNSQTRIFGIRAIITPDEIRGTMLLFCDEVDPE